jgi:hypothetical protein
MNQSFTYRAELIACNLAIHTLGHARPIRSIIQKSARLIQTRELPVWISTIAAGGILGMSAGFILYCLIAFSR